MLCLVGLGNPGVEYAETRHNVGFRVIDRLALRHEIAVTRHRLRSVYGRGRVAGVDCLLVKPQTFMNDSGEAVARVLLYYKVAPADVLLICDDLNLELGMVRFRRGGSDGGHKGVRSVIAYLGTEEVPRLRLGIGQPHEAEDAIAYVLSPFARSEAEKAEEMIERAAEAVETYVKSGIEAAMNLHNS